MTLYNIAHNQQVASTKQAIYKKFRITHKHSNLPTPLYNKQTKKRAYPKAHPHTLYVSKISFYYYNLILNETDR